MLRSAPLPTPARYGIMTLLREGKQNIVVQHLGDAHAEFLAALEVHNLS